MQCISIREAHYDTPIRCLRWLDVQQSISRRNEARYLTRPSRLSCCSKYSRSIFGTGGNNKCLGNPLPFCFLLKDSNFARNATKLTVAYFYKRVILIAIKYNLTSNNCKCNPLLCLGTSACTIFYWFRNRSYKNKIMSYFRLFSSSRCLLFCFTCYIYVAELPAHCSSFCIMFIFKKKSNK